MQSEPSEETSRLYLLQINHLLLGFILRPAERQEGRKGDAQIHISAKRKCAISSYVGLEAYLFQAPQSIDAAIMLWILAFSVNDRTSFGKEKRNQFLTFKLQPHPKKTPGFSFSTTAIAPPPPACGDTHRGMRLL